MCKLIHLASRSRYIHLVRWEYSLGEWKNLSPKEQAKWLEARESLSKAREEIAQARGWSDDPKEGVPAFARGSFDQALEHASQGEGGHPLDYATGEF